MEYNTEEVLAASENLAGSRFGQPAPVPAAGSVRPAANMLIQQNAGRCMRSEHCTKPAGHPGFCVRTHAAAAAAAARKARQANAAAAAAAAAAPQQAAAMAAAAAAAAAESHDGLLIGPCGAPVTVEGGDHEGHEGGVKREHEHGSHAMYGANGHAKRKRKADGERACCLRCWGQGARDPSQPALQRPAPAAPTQATPDHLIPTTPPSRRLWLRQRGRLPGSCCPHR